MNSRDLLLSVKLDELSAYSRQAITSHFPRCERHALGQDIRNCLSNCRRHYTIAFKRTKKLGALFDLDVEIELLRSLIRSSHDLRYMDDFVVLVKDKAEAKALLDAIDKEVQKIGLTLNPKSCYFPWQRGVDFCGYRAWPTHRLPRKRTVKSARKRLKKYAEQYKQGRCNLNDYKSRAMSFIAYMNRCQSRTTLEAILSESRL